MYFLENGVVYQKGDKLRKVISVDEIANVIARVHCDCKHVGIAKTYAEIQNHYYGISREHVTKLLANAQYASPIR